MSEQGYLTEVRRALFARGVWGAEARRITEQLSDHYRAKIDDLRADGVGRSEAEQKTLAALGGVSAIAEAAAADVRSRRWLARYPWLLAGGGVFLATIAFSIAIFVVSMYAAGIFEGPIPHRNYARVLPILQTGVVFVNWLPFCAGCAFLSWQVQRSQGSWKVLLIASIAIGMATSAFFVSITPPLHGPGSGSINFGGTAWVIPLFEVVAIFSKTLRDAVGSGNWSLIFKDLALLKLFLPVTTVLFVRHMLPRLKLT